MFNYCQLCGNNKTQAKDRLCARCRRVCQGPLREAYQRWLKQGEETPRCCGRISSDIAFDRTGVVAVSLNTHLYFHGKYWEGEHEGTGVEFGAMFYPDCAGTYYNRDFGAYCDSESYGELISYEDPDFWAKLDAQLDEAPQAAYNADLRSCEECGYHYHADNSHDCDR